jgi:hypothetical protein
MEERKLVFRLVVSVMHRQPLGKKRGEYKYPLIPILMV